MPRFPRTTTFGYKDPVVQNERQAIAFAANGHPADIVEAFAVAAGNYMATSAMAEMVADDIFDRAMRIAGRS